jgi:1-acyl-sn-glycerol-3-phosphate acyltransferase
VITALLVLVFLTFYIPPASVAGCLWAILTGSPRLLYRLGRLGVGVGLRLSRTRILVEGREHLGDARNTVVMPNHVSNLDAPVVFLALGIDFKALVKLELFEVPFLGRAMKVAGLVPVDRKNRLQAEKAVDAAAAGLAAGQCFLIYPEGTRSATGELGAFKKGGFVAAIQAGSRIVPVALTGVGELMPRGSFRIRPGTVRVRVLPAVEAGRYKYEERDVLLREVRGAMERALAESGGAREGRHGE